MIPIIPIFAKGSVNPNMSLGKMYLHVFAPVALSLGTIFGTALYSEYSPKSEAEKKDQALYQVAVDTNKDGVMSWEEKNSLSKELLHDDSRLANARLNRLSLEERSKLFSDYISHRSGTKLQTEYKQ